MTTAANPKTSGRCGASWECYDSSHQIASAPAITAPSNTVGGSAFRKATCGPLPDDFIPFKVADPRSPSLAVRSR